MILFISGCAWQGDMHGRGHVWQGGMHGGRGACIAWGMHGIGVCMTGGVCMARETATAADGTHPTGMHSCLLHFFVFLKMFKE